MIVSRIQIIASELIEDNLSKECWIQFKDRWLDFYIDCNGQRGHYIVRYKKYTDANPYQYKYIIRRNLSFTNKIDEGKQDAILGVLDISKCKIISIQEDKIEFESFIFHFKGNAFVKDENYNQNLI